MANNPFDLNYTGFGLGNGFDVGDYSIPNYTVKNPYGLSNIRLSIPDTSFRDVLNSNANIGSYAKLLEEARLIHGDLDRFGKDLDRDVLNSNIGNVGTAIRGGLSILDTSLSIAKAPDTTNLQNQINDIGNWRSGAVTSRGLANEAANFGSTPTINYDSVGGLGTVDMLKGIGSNVLTGVTTGSTFGLPGAIVGAGVGLLGGMGGAWAGSKNATDAVHNLSKQSYKAQLKRARTLSDTANNINSNTNRMWMKQGYVHAEGGRMGTPTGEFVEFNEGGTHQQNPNGGVPQGISQDGMPNLVEQDETRFGDYVFSSRIKASKKILKDFGIFEKDKDINAYSGKSYADISKEVAKRSGYKDAPTDPLAIETFRNMMSRLSDAEEYQKQQEAQRKMASELSKLPPEQLQSMMGQVGLQPQVGMFQRGGFVYPMAVPMTGVSDNTYMAPQTVQDASLVDRNARIRRSDITESQQRQAVFTSGRPRTEQDVINEARNIALQNEAVRQAQDNLMSVGRPNTESVQSAVDILPQVVKAISEYDYGNIPSEIINMMPGVMNVNMARDARRMIDNGQTGAGIATGLMALGMTPLGSELVGFAPQMARTGVGLARDARQLARDYAEFSRNYNEPQVLYSSAVPGATTIASKAKKISAFLKGRDVSSIRMIELDDFMSNEKIKFSDIEEYAKKSRKAKELVNGEAFDRMKNLRRLWAEADDIEAIDNARRAAINSGVPQKTKLSNGQYYIDWTGNKTRVTRGDEVTIDGVRYKKDSKGELTEIPWKYEYSVDGDNIVVKGGRRGDEEYVYSSIHKKDGDVLEELKTSEPDTYNSIMLRNAIANGSDHFVNSNGMVYEFIGDKAVNTGMNEASYNKYKSSVGNGGQKKEYLNPLTGPIRFIGNSARGIRTGILNWRSGTKGDLITNAGIQGDEAMARRYGEQKTAIDEKIDGLNEKTKAYRNTETLPWFFRNYSKVHPSFRKAAVGIDDMVILPSAVIGAIGGGRAIFNAISNRNDDGVVNAEYDTTPVSIQSNVQDVDATNTTSLQDMGFSYGNGGRMFQYGGWTTGNGYEGYEVVPQTKKDPIKLNTPFPSQQWITDSYNEAHSQYNPDYVVEPVEPTTWGDMKYAYGLLDKVDSRPVINVGSTSGSSNGNRGVGRGVDIESLLRYAPAINSGINAITDVVGLTNTPDYANAETIENSVRRPNMIGYQPVGMYQSYRPVDERYLMAGLAREGATNRGVAVNSANGNMAVALANLAAQNRATQEAMGTLGLNIDAQNNDARNKIIAQNNALDNINAERALKVEMQNQTAMDRYYSELANARLRGAMLREQIAQNAENAKAENLTTFADNLGNIGHEEWAYNAIRQNPALLYALDRNGNFSYTGASKVFACGGKAGLKKKVGL